MKHAHPRRPWLRYSIRGLLLLTTVICVWLAIVFNQARRQRNAVRAITSAGGLVSFDYHFQQNRKDAEPPGPAWLRRLVGDELFRTPQHVELRGDQITDAFLAEHLAGLRGVQVLVVDSAHVSDAALANVAKWDSIHILSLQCPRVTDTGLEHLAKMRQLTALELQCPQVTDAGMQQLSRLDQLKSLRLGCPRVTADGVKRLAPLKELNTVVCLRDSGNEHVAALLRSRMNIDLTDVPLVDAVEYLAQTYSVNIHLEDISESQRLKHVRAVGNHLTLEFTLNAVLAPADLDYYLRNEVIVVAPREQTAPFRAGGRAFRETLPNLDWMAVDW